MEETGLFAFCAYPLAGAISTIALAEKVFVMTHLRGDWILWAVFGISLALVAFTYFAGQRPSQQLILIQLLGLGCGLFAMLRRRRGKK